MSFRCDSCNRVEQKPIRKVVETREKIYPVRYASDGKTIIDKGGRGREIVHEMNLCADCDKRV